ncbi:MAG: helix-turn-helix transcriptional regulator [Buchananella hordeovulneris]|nr:helix-turn-helix transcriptional regulator [Buchananella hordeovulneris]
MTHNTSLSILAEGVALSRRNEILDLAILGQLRRPAHGYELRKRLTSTLGALRTWSFGSLYPALRRLTGAGLIAAEAAAGSARGKIVYHLTPAGTRHLSQALSLAGPTAWDDASFAVHFASFASADVPTRLRILEGRRALARERLAAARTAAQAAATQADAYAAALARHLQTQLETHLQWVEEVMSAERSPGFSVEMASSQSQQGEVDE